MIIFWLCVKAEIEEKTRETQFLALRLLSKKPMTLRNMLELDFLFLKLSNS